MNNHKHTQNDTFQLKNKLNLILFCYFTKRNSKAAINCFKIKIIYHYSKLISTTDTDYDYLQGTEPVFSIVVV